MQDMDFHVKRFWFLVSQNIERWNDLYFLMLVIASRIICLRLGYTTGDGNIA